VNDPSVEVHVMSDDVDDWMLEKEEDVISTAGEVEKMK
jgi:hypothetical protein